MPANSLRLHRPGLVAARVLWIVLAPITLLYVVVGLPRLLIAYGSLCDGDIWPVCPAIRSGLRLLGLDWNFAAWYTVLWVVVVCIPHFVLCSLLAWRRNGDPKTLLFSTALLVTMVMNVDYDLPDVMMQSYPAAKALVFTLIYCGQIGPILFYVFPDGRFVPGWTRWAAAVSALLNLAAVYVYWQAQPFTGWGADLFNFILWVVLPLTVAYALVYRYRYAANLEQRQQIKWVMWMTAAGSMLIVVDNVIHFSGGWFGWNTTMPIWYTVYETLISRSLWSAMILLLSLGFYVAILRYRLWDIDLFINRSLVYGGLTVLLGSVLVGVFAATEAVLGIMVKGMQAGAAGIVSVIVVIALFLPVRDRLQRFVDSRFYGVDPSHERAVQAAIAQERDRLSQELHDSVTQSLYGLTIMAESCQRLARDDEARKPLAEMGDVARQALKEMRLLIHELRPPVLAEEGLLSALHQRLAAVERRSGIEANLAIDEVVDLPVAAEEALYHIAIEALNNAIKHAAATSVTVSLHTHDTWVELEIADDGKGFDPSADSSKGGMGLASMHQRAEESGGTLTIHSTTGQGTKVTARIPYHKAPRQYRTRPGSQSPGGGRLAE